MKLLLIESRPGVATDLRCELEHAGHDVSSCYDADTNSPCRGVHEPSSCPLESRHVDLAVVARPRGEPDSLFEMGAVCAERHRSPVIHVDPTIPPRDVDTIVRRAAAAGKDRIEAAYSAVVRAALSSKPVTTVETSREPARVQVTLSVDSSDPHIRARLADNARAAVRAFDPFVSVIDVAVRDLATEDSPRHGTDGPIVTADASGMIDP